MSEKPSCYNCVSYKGLDGLSGHVCCLHPEVKGLRSNVVGLARIEEIRKSLGVEFEDGGEPGIKSHHWPWNFNPELLIKCDAFRSIAKFDATVPGNTAEPGDVKIAIDPASKEETPPPTSAETEKTTEEPPPAPSDDKKTEDEPPNKEAPPDEPTE